MSARKKYLVTGVITAVVLFLGFWYYWSPRAWIRVSFSFGDSFAIHWLIRAQTFQPILRIYQDTDGSVYVDTGIQRGPLDGHGNHYRLKKSSGGWKIVEDGGWVS